MGEKFIVDWIDHHREPQCAPDPRYPDGIDLDLTIGRLPACKVALPYPAKRCGLFYVECKMCGNNVFISTAGRPDDPRSVKLGCMIHAKKDNLH